MIIVITGLFLLFNGTALFVAIWRPRLLDIPDWFLYSSVYPFFLWHGATLFIGFILVAGWILRLPLKATLTLTRAIAPLRTKLEHVTNNPGFQSFDKSRRRFMRNGMYVVTGTSFAGSAYGMLVGRSTPEVTTAEFLLDGLDPALDNFTIGLISDIHSSVHMPKSEMVRYVSLLNSLQTDLIVVTGDFVDSAVEEVYPFAEAFSGLQAPCGIYGVMGNHDYYNANPETVARQVDDCGVRLLMNEKVVIEKGAAKFYLLGVDDTGKQEVARESMNAAVGIAPLRIPRILLCHRPYFLKQAALLGIDLVLSGHTHGGQVVLGRMGNTVFAPASIASKYLWGKYSEEKSQMYVSRGIGTVGLPMRINCPPEVTRIVLKASGTPADAVSLAR
jgi:hypothetical protein